MLPGQPLSARQLPSGCIPSWGTAPCAGPKTSNTVLGIGPCETSTEVRVAFAERKTSVNSIAEYLGFA